MMTPVVLLHGLRHTSLSMRKMARELGRSGREVFNLGYPSGSSTVEGLAELVSGRIADQFGHDQPLDFITHSLGSIILRQISRTHFDHVQRAVMLGPPNQGSELVDQFERFASARLVMGPAGQQLGISEESLPNCLGPVEFEAGVIAGSKPDNPFARWFVPGPEDGRVSVARTRVEGMADHIIVPYGHFYLMQVDDVIHQTIHFLDHGRFKQDRQDTHD